MTVGRVPAPSRTKASWCWCCIACATTLTARCLTRHNSCHPQTAAATRRKGWTSSSPSHAPGVVAPAQQRWLYRVCTPCLLCCCVAAARGVGLRRVRLVQCSACSARRRPLSPAWPEINWPATAGNTGSFSAFSPDGLDFHRQFTSADLEKRRCLQLAAHQMYTACYTRATADSARRHTTTTAPPTLHSMEGHDAAGRCRWHVGWLCVRGSCDYGLYYTRQRATSAHARFDACTGLRSLVKSGKAVHVPLSPPHHSPARHWQRRVSCQPRPW